MNDFVGTAGTTADSVSDRDATSCVREVRQQESDHRIANSFQIAAAILNREERSLTDLAEAKMALRQAAARLLAVARIHRTLCQSPRREPIAASDVLEAIGTDLLDSLGIELEIHTGDVILPFKVAMDLGLIVSELAINTAKHGVIGDRTPTLTVEADTNGFRSIRLRIFDDGPGLPEAFDLNQTWGVGTSIILSTVARLGGSMIVMPVTNERTGAGFEIVLPAMDP